MKVLRKNLDQARGQYKALHYPGDLAADVLGGQPQRVLEYGAHRRINRWLWIGGAVAASAAAIVIVVVGVHSFNQRVELAQPSVHPVYDDDEVSLGTIPVVSTVDYMPTEMQLVPAAQDMSVSMPSLSFSSQSDQQQLPQQPQSNNTSTSTIEEAVL